VSAQDDTAMCGKWRGGAFATIITGGTIRIGDRVTMRDANRDLFLE
jgi:MOSC domain-containing protein YiiM